MIGLEYKVVMRCEFEFPETGVNHTLRLERDGDGLYSVHYRRTGPYGIDGYLVQGVRRSEAVVKFHEFTQSIQFGEV